MDHEAQALAEYVSMLVRHGRFVVQKDLQHICEDHIGIDLADAVLQRQLHWNAKVRPRLDRIRSTYTRARTISGLNAILRQVPAATFLGWPASQPNRRWCRVKVFLSLVNLFNGEGVDTETDLKVWLSNGDNVAKLRAVDQIGDKTIDYLKLRVGIETVAIDVHLTRFLREAEIDAGHMKYADQRAIMLSAANLLGLAPSYFDYSVWRHMTLKREHTQCVRPSVPQKRPSAEAKLPATAQNFAPNCTASKGNLNRNRSVQNA